MTRSGKEVEEPGGFDGAVEADERQRLFAAVFDVEGYQEIGAGFGFEQRGAAGCEQQLVVFAAARDAIGEGGENGERQSVGVVSVALGRADDAADLFQVTLGDGIEPGVEQCHQVAGLGAGARAEQSGNGTAFFANAAMDRFDHEARQARVQRIAGHLAGAVGTGSKTF